MLLIYMMFIDLWRNNGLFSQKFKYLLSQMTLAWLVMFYWIPQHIVFSVAKKKSQATLTSL